jgi:hypothetical protein
MTTETIYPELGQTTTAAIEYTTSYSNGFYLTTALSLAGRGIKPLGDGSNHARRLKTYHATEAALKKLTEKHTAVYIASL